MSKKQIVDIVMKYEKEKDSPNAVAEIVEVSAT